MTATIADFSLCISRYSPHVVLTGLLGRNELPAVLSEAAPRQSLPSLLEGFPPEGHAHQAHSYSAEIPAVAVVDHEPNGPADSSDMVVQSHPNPDADPEARAPRPALTVFMQEGVIF